MSVILSVLGTIGTWLGINEAQKLVDGIILSPTESQILANKILAAAEKRGGEVLNEAINAIQNIPSLAGSPTVKDKLIEARKAATKRYTDVEKQVTDMKTQAANDAAKVQNEGQKSILSKGWDLIKGTNPKDKATNFAKDAEQAIVDWKPSDDTSNNNK